MILDVTFWPYRPPSAAINQLSPMDLKFYQHVQLNKPNKFSNYLENRFEVDRKISVPEVSKLKKSTDCNSLLGGYRGKPWLWEASWGGDESEETGLGPEVTRIGRNYIVKTVRISSRACSVTPAFVAHETCGFFGKHTPCLLMLAVSCGGEGRRSQWKGEREVSTGKREEIVN